MILILTWDIFREALFSRIRDRSRPLVTICNHTSNLDDPIMWGFLPTDILSQPKLMRWSWAAKEVCFMKPSFSRFFGFGQAIPVVRGAGLNQFGVDFAVERLKNNEWVHVFAEGRVNQRKKIVPFRWGVSELIFRACMQENVMISPIPTIIPLYLYGMWEAQPGGDTTLNPNNKWTLPRFNKTIELFVGQEIDVQDLVSRAKSVGIKQARADITLRIQEVVEEMELLAFAKLNNPLFPQITIETLPSKSLVASEVAATVDHALEATKQALAVKQGIKSPNEII